MKSIRGKASQNLMVATVNAAIEQGLIKLDPVPFDEAAFEFELAGLPVQAHVRETKYNEVRFLVIACPTELGRRFKGVFITGEHWKFGAAFSSGWLERRAGKYLQPNDSYHGSKAVIRALSELTIEPNGFVAKKAKDKHRREWT